MRCADLLQRKAQHRQSPLTDGRLAQRREYAERHVVSGQLNVCEGVDCAAIHFKPSAKVRALTIKLLYFLEL